MQDLNTLQDAVRKALKLEDHHRLRVLLMHAKSKMWLRDLPRLNLSRNLDKEKLIQLAQDFLKLPLLTKTTIKERGWTERTIIKYLGDPDLIVPNPLFKSAAPMRLYSQSRVETIECDPQVASALKQTLTQRPRRQAVGLAKAHAKTGELVDYVNSLEVHLPTYERAALIKLGVRHYNELWSERGEDKHATINDEAEFLARITVNYLRHCCSDYEQILESLGGKLGCVVARDALRQKINDAIFLKYPFLAEK